MSFICRKPVTGLAFSNGWIASLPSITGRNPPWSFDHGSSAGETAYAENHTAKAIHNFSLSSSPPEEIPGIPVSARGGENYERSTVYVIVSSTWRQNHQCFLLKNGSHFRQVRPRRRDLLFDKIDIRPVGNHPADEATFTRWVILPSCRSNISPEDVPFRPIKRFPALQDKSNVAFTRTFFVTPVSADTVSSEAAGRPEASWDTTCEIARRRPADHFLLDQFLAPTNSTDTANFSEIAAPIPWKGYCGDASTSARSEWLVDWRGCRLGWPGVPPVAGEIHRKSSAGTCSPIAATTCSEKNRLFPGHNKFML